MLLLPHLLHGLPLLLNLHRITTATHNPHPAILLLLLLQLLARILQLQLCDFRDALEFLLVELDAAGMGGSEAARHPCGGRYHRLHRFLCGGSGGGWVVGWLVVDGVSVSLRLVKKIIQSVKFIFLVGPPVVHVRG